MFAAAEKDRKHHQVGTGEKQLFGFGSGGFCCARNDAKMAAASEVAEMLPADARQPGDFIFREELLAGFDGWHAVTPLEFS